MADELITGPRFGEVPPGAAWRLRPGAYGLAIVDSRVLVVDTPQGRFLPGGGLREGEDAALGLRRECLEETGRRVGSAVEFARADQVVWTGTEYVVKACRFFRCALEAGVEAGSEDDHRASWREHAEVATSLAEHASRWAVRVLFDAP